MSESSWRRSVSRWFSIGTLALLVLASIDLGVVVASILPWPAREAAQRLAIALLLVHGLLLAVLAIRAGGAGDDLS